MALSYCHVNMGKAKDLSCPASVIVAWRKNENPGHVKTNHPGHKLITFNCLWLLALSGEADPLMVISHWQAFLLWVCLFGTCIQCFVYLHVLWHWVPHSAWLENSLPFLSHKTCMCYFFQVFPTSCILRNSEWLIIPCLSPSYLRLYSPLCQQPTGQFFSFLLEESPLPHPHTLHTFPHPCCFHFGEKATRIYDEGM